MSQRLPVPEPTPAKPESLTQPAGYGYILRNPQFRYLLFAQILSQSALNATISMQLVLIERATESAASQVGLLMAFNLPAVLFSTLAGVIVDRVSKKQVMFLSNAFRIVTQVALTVVAFFLLERRIDPGLSLWGIYVITFATSAIGQIFAPAEGGMIPLIVGRRGLMASNSLFSISYIAMQAGGLLLLGPLAVKLFGIVPALVIGIFLYGAAAALVWLLPLDRPARPGDLHADSAYRKLVQELNEGWLFALTRPSILVALAQLSLVGLMVYVMAAIAPGYASRVLNFAPEDIVYVFWPAGAGLVVTTFLVGRYGTRFRRHLLPNIGLFVSAAGVLGLGVVPELARSQQSLGFLVATCALLLGTGLALIQIPAQTVIQEDSTDAIRGRVLTVQFTLGNLIAVPPLLALGYLADAIGISQVAILLGLILVAGALWNSLYVRRRIFNSADPGSSLP